MKYKTKKTESLKKQSETNNVFTYTNDHIGNTIDFGGGREPQFEPYIKNAQIEPENENIKTENEKTKSGAEKIKTANGQKANFKIKTKEKTTTVQKYSNHIEFVDYLPTREVITYRHLFAYGFYIE